MTTRTHGCFLVALAAAVPLGEGLAFIALAGVGVCAWQRRRELNMRVLWEGPAAPVLTGLALWLGGGILALHLGHEGVLRPAEWGRWVPYLMVPLVILSMTSLPIAWLQRAGLAFLLALGLAAAFGLCQYTFNIRPGETLTRSTATSQAFVPGQTRAVAGGFYFHRLKMAHVLLVGLAILLARQIFADLTRRARASEGAAFLIFAATLLLTFTRGAFLGLAASLVGCLLVASWRWRLAGLLLALAAALIIASVPAMRQRVSSIGGTEAADVRAFIWAQGVRIIADHPLGVGLGNYPTLVARYYDEVDPNFEVRTYPHHVLLAAWAETGPHGMLGYAFAWVSFITACITRLRWPSVAQRVAAGAGFAGALAFWTVGMTHDVLYHNAVAFAFCGLMAWTLAYFTLTSREPREGVPETLAQTHPREAAPRASREAL